jgi:hypothetical protein
VAASICIKQKSKWERAKGDAFSFASRSFEPRLLVDGHPVSDCWVVALPVGAQTGAEAATSVVVGQTDEAGVFAFAGLPPGKYTVLATTNALPALFTTANPPVPTLTKTPEILNKFLQARPRRCRSGDAYADIAGLSTGARGGRRRGALENPGSCGAYLNGSSRARGLSDQSRVRMAPPFNSEEQSAMALRRASARSTGISGSPRSRTTLGFARAVWARIRGKSRSFVRSTS